MYMLVINQYKEKINKCTPPPRPLSLSEIDKRNYKCIYLNIFWLYKIQLGLDTCSIT